MSEAIQSLKDPFEVMPHDTAVIFNRLRTNALLRPFVLIGGTGLTLHIGHRTSEDLDFITSQNRLPRAALRKLEEELTEAGHAVVWKDDPAAYDDFLEAGMDLRDHNQNLIIDNTVKVTFFTGEPCHSRLLDKAENENGFRVGSFQELCQLKAIVAAGRSKSRDWLDLFVLETDHQFGLREWKAAYDKAGLTPAHFETALNRICGGKLPGGDEGYTTLMPNPPTLKEITEHFRKLRKVYEMEISRKLRA